MKTKPLAFINYRREDEGPASRFIKAELDKVFVSSQIFMDIDEIRAGDLFPQQIRRALRACTVLIVVIGKNWLKLQDEYFRRRIDNKNDWVRNEIEYALERKNKRKIKVIPLLLGANLPARESLPSSITSLANCHAISVNTTTVAEDVTRLVDALARCGLQKSRNSGSLTLPKPQKFPMPLPIPELKSQLKKLKSWTIELRPEPDKPDSVRYEIQRKYTFRTFKDAIAFMNSSVDYIDEVEHHPRWDNAWRDLTIKLSTWDIGFKVSNLDIELAKYFEKKFSEYEGGKKKKTTTQKSRKQGKRTR